MKIIKKMGLVVACIFSCLLATRMIAEDVASKSFMYIHQPFQNSALDKTLWHTALFDKDKKNAVQVTSFYQKAFDTDRIPQFFLPTDHTRVRVNKTEFTRDVAPEWLGLPATFDGYLSIAPTYHACGGRLEARRMIGDLLPFPFLKSIWMSASVPFVVTKQNLNLTQESVLNAGSDTTDVYDIVTAFKNPAWNYNKIDARLTKKTIPEIRLGYGSTILSNGQAHAVTYSSLSIPLHKPNNNEYMFDNQIGHNGHFGIMWGVSMQLPINNEKDSYQVNLHVDLENTFLIKDHEYRTFDLYNKQWSKFLLFRQKDQPLDITIPGVNILTQKVSVNPTNMVDFALGMRVNSKNIETDFGYGLWAHGGERIKFTETWKEIYGIAGSIANTSASASTIATKAADDDTFTPVKLSDIDLTSAQMPSVMVHKLFASVGYVSKKEKCDMLFGLGGFVEMPHSRTKAFALWGITVKAGVGF